MAASSDELVGGEPFTPSVFLDLPLTPPRSNGEGDDPALPADLVLPVISRMLMEDDDTEDELFFHEHPDYPSLLQAQRPFAQILSDAATTDGSGDVLSSLPPRSSPAFADATWPYDPEELCRLLLSRSRTCPLDMGEGDGEEHGHGEALPSTFLGGQRHGVTMDMLNMAFLKGMEAASKFLPTNGNLLVRGEAVSTEDLPATARKNWRSWDDLDLEAETGRKVKIMAPEPEESGEAVDKMIVDGYDACMEKMKGLRIARIAEAEKKMARKKGANSNGKPTTHSGQSSSEAVEDLRTLLIHCAQAMSTGSHQTTTDLLRQIRRRSSPAGDATQRLAHCFAEGLETRLAGSGSRVYKSLVAKRSSVVEYFQAYDLYLTACCFETMAYKFSGMTICNAIAGRKKLHIVDYGVGYGFQWPSLLAYMATWEGGPPEVRVTGIDLP